MKTKTILVTAATPWEARPLARRWELDRIDARLYRGAVLGRELWLVRTGMGPQKTAEALALISSWFQMEPAETLVVSSGFAGALQSGIRSGDLVADVREAPIEVAQAARDTARRTNAALHLGAFHSSETVLTSPDAKRAAGEKHRAVAVDMESSTVREWCRCHGAVYVGLRAVLDALEDRLPAGFSNDEEPSAGSMTGFALTHWTELPWLVTLGVRQRRAMRNLSNFMDDWLERILSDSSEGSAEERTSTGSIGR